MFVSVQNYNLTVEATDDGGLTGSMWLSVQLTDVNDQTPVFTKNVYPITVQENIANDTQVLVVTAMDSDTGLDGQWRLEWMIECGCIVQFCSVQSLDRLGRRGDMRDDSAEIFFQSFLQEIFVSSCGTGRHVHSLMLSIQYRLFSTALSDLANSRPAQSLMLFQPLPLPALSSSTCHCALQDSFGQT